MVKRGNKDKEIIERLERIEDKQDISSFYGWYFLGIALVIADATFTYMNQLNLAGGLLLIGFGLIVLGLYKSNKIEKKLKKKK